jgi:hypothetical protein
LDATLIKFVSDYHIGDFASIIGVFISLIGFGFTLRNVIRSREAAERAQAAAQVARNSIRTFETVVDFTGAIALPEEIKRAHRNQQWILLPDRYATLRKTLIGIRKTRPDLSAHQLSVVQATISNLSDLEKLVEKSLPNVPANSHARFNALLSVNIDELAGVLAELKFPDAGAP